jgi:CHASE2 domain-containing sensor protein
MHPIIKNILAIFLGIFLGGVVNMSLILVSGSVIPTPVGVDMTTIEGLRDAQHLLQPQHFVFPFLAHALGTFVGSYLAARIAANNKMVFAMAIALLNLIGGITAVALIPAPLWFDILDLLVAYLPMGYFAGKIAKQSEN